MSCERRDRDRYGRAIAIFGVGGEDLNVWMVGQGWAIAYTRLSRRYLPQKVKARFADRGIWEGDFMTPQEWRASKRRYQKRC